MGIFQSIATKLGNLLSGEPAKDPNMEEASSTETDEAVLESKETTEEERVAPEEELPTPKEEKRPLPNSVEIRNRIKKSTLSMLNSLYLSNPELCKTKHLVVWLDTDTITFNSYSGFGQELENYWAVESGYSFEKVELRQGRPSNEKDARKIDSGVDSIAIYLQEHKSDIGRGIVKRARISIFGGRGSLIQDPCELSSEMLEKEGVKCFNIGRGAFPDVGAGAYRQNHIAVDDKNNLETNRYVSRAHAHIGFSEIIGFYLQVEYGGSRLSGNRTRIFRGEEKIEVENVVVKEPLQNGDLIELGKAVVLQFIEIE
jgi:hypothetical protein